MFKKVSRFLKMWNTAWFGKMGVTNKLMISKNKTLNEKTLKIPNIWRHIIWSRTYTKTLIDRTFIWSPLIFTILIIEKGVTIYKNHTLRKESLARIDFWEFFCGYCAEINFRDLGFTKELPAIDFLIRDLDKYFEGIRFCGCLNKCFFCEFIHGFKNNLYVKYLSYIILIDLG